MIKKTIIASAIAFVAAITLSTGAANASSIQPSLEHRDIHGDIDGHADRDHDAHPNWIHYDHYGWYPGVVTLDQCNGGGGHVNWDHDQCDGGRFNGFLVQR